MVRERESSWILKFTDYEGNLEDNTDFSLETAECIIDGRIPESKVTVSKRRGKIKNFKQTKSFSLFPFVV